MPCLKAQYDNWLWGLCNSLLRALTLRPLRSLGS